MQLAQPVRRSSHAPTPTSALLPSSLVPSPTQLHPLLYNLPSPIGITAEILIIFNPHRHSSAAIEPNSTTDSDLTHRALCAEPDTRYVIAMDATSAPGAVPAISGIEKGEYEAVEARFVIATTPYSATEIRALRCLNIRCCTGRGITPHLSHTHTYIVLRPPCADLRFPPQSPRLPLPQPRQETKPPSQ